MDTEAGERLRAYMEPRIRDALLPWSERHGIGRDTIYALWRGREPRPETMRRIADALGVSYDELVAAREGRATEGQPATTPEELTKVLIVEHQRTQSMLRLVLAALGGVVPPTDEEVHREFVLEQERRLGRTPSKPRTADHPDERSESSPSQVVHSRRQRSGNG